MTETKSKHLHSLLGGQITLAVHQILLDPARQLVPLVRPGKPLVGEEHDTVVSLPTHDSPHTLRCVPHGVKREEVILSDL